MSPPRNSSDASDYRGLALASTAVMEFAAPVVVGAWLDQRYGWAPWGVAVGAVLGLVGGTAHLFLMMKRAERAERAKSGQDDKRTD